MAAQVLVVGSVNVDYLLAVERLPGPGETVAGGDLVRAPGGKGGNAAAASAALGAETFLVAALGRDADGDQAERDLRDAGVCADAIQRVAAPTGAAIVLTDASDENLIAIAPGANVQLDSIAAAAAVARLARPGAVVVVNFEVTDAVIAVVASECRRLGLAMVADPAPARPMAPEMVAACALITPNAHEVGLLGFGSPEDLLAAGAGAVAVTMGGEGCRLHERAGDPTLIAPHPVRVRDTVGAGDAFAAGAGVGLAEGLTMEHAVRLGNAAGALATTGAGARGGRLDRTSAQALIDAA